MISLAKFLPGKKKDKAEAEEKDEPAAKAGAVATASEENAEPGFAGRALAGLRVASANTRLLLLAGLGAVLGLGAIGGAAWWIFGGHPTQPAAAPSSGAKVGLAMPAAPARPAGAPQGALTPPPAAGGLNVLARKGEQADSQPPPEPAPATPAAATAPQQPAAGVPGKTVEETEAPAEEAAAGGPAFERALGGGSLNVVAQEVAGASGGFQIPALTVASFARFPDLPPAPPLPAAPDSTLVEDSPQGPLPKVSKDKKPWQVYARPSQVGEDRLRVALVVTGLGMSRAASMAAIGKLPPQVSLAFSPYAADLTEWMIRARRAGHEVLVALPMESDRFPYEDAGPFGLQAEAKTEDNVKRLEMVLSRFGGYAGVVGTLGGRFKTAEAQLRPVLEALKARGLMYVEGTGREGSLAPKIAQEIGLPKAVNDVALDQTPSRAGVDAKLAEVEAILQQRRVAVATLELTPAGLERLASWIASLEAKNIALVPVTALADKQTLQ